jgi:hypothetical protein
MALFCAKAKLAKAMKRRVRGKISFKRICKMLPVAWLLVAETSENW